MAAIIGQSRLTSGVRLGPAKSCQRLVTKDGTISRPAAVSGATKAPSAPMATVGNPMPVVRLTTPATKNVAAARRISDIEGAVM